MTAAAPPHPGLNETHDPAARSWVASANGHGDFPIQNLPFGVFRQSGGDARCGVAIGDEIVDLRAALDAGLFSGEGELAAQAAGGPSLAPLLELPAAAVSALRRQLFALLRAGGPGDGAAILVAQSAVEMATPCRFGAFTDFLVSYDHAFRLSGGNPAPAFQYLPIAYNGRASSISVAPTVRRPMGQSRGAAGAIAYGPEPMLDFELELGIVLGGGNRLGEPLPIAGAAAAIFGYCLLNDWSARGIQFFETQPLGPFLGKNFATTIAPWIVTAEALAPFRIPARPRIAGAPPLPDHLDDPGDQAGGLYDIALECRIGTAAMRAAGLPPEVIVETNADTSYWTFAQMVAHHASNGCNLEPGDLIGSGTLSGPEDRARACLAEVTGKGTIPFTLANGERRIYLDDGDEILFRGKARAAGAVAIGFGECRARVVPATGLKEIER